MKKSTFLIFLFSLALFGERLKLTDEIAFYPLQDGTGTVVKEIQGRTPPGTLYRSFWTNQDGITIADFSGMKNSKTAAMELPSFDFKNEMTITLWVNAYWWNDNWAPLFYKSDISFGLRNNKNHPGQLMFLIRDPKMPRASILTSNTTLEARRWYHIALTFVSGKEMKIYINGVLDAEKHNNLPDAIGQDNSRCHLGGRAKPGKNPSDFYAGVLANLHLYSRALSQAEILQLRNSENTFDTSSGIEVAFPTHGEIACTLKDSTTIYKSGALQVKTADGTCFMLNSSYSYPQPTIMGFNHLAAAPMKDMEATWSPKVTRLPDGSVQLKANGSCLQLTRVIALQEDGRLRISDTLTNPTNTDQAVLFQHQVTPNAPIAAWTIGGEDNQLTNSDGRFLPANPTGFIATKGHNALAWVAEDDIFRCHQTINVKKLADNHHAFQFGSRKIGVPANKSHTIVFTLYKQTTDDYFDFINRLRKDWKIPQVTIPGPLGLIRTAAQSSNEYKKYTKSPEEFKKVLQRKQMKLITLNPWFNYWDGRIFNTHQDFKEHMQQAMKTIRAVNPGAQFLVSIETYCYCLHEEELKDVPAPKDFSWDKVTPGTVQRIRQSQWADSITYTANGSIRLYPATEVKYGKDFKPIPALTVMVHPVRGNHFYYTRLKEYDFLINEVGFDGIYQDMFGYSSPTEIDYEHWDGFSIIIAPNGTISKKYAHLGPLTAPARADWIRKILAMKKIALTNFGAPTTREMQTLPYINFCEAAGRNLGRQNLEQIPPLATGCAMNHLCTPLGYGPHKNEEVKGSLLMKRVRAYLRHGCLYVNTSFRNRLPETGPESGEYGPINHSFPITVTELHKGWVKGKERIVSCVSYTTTWDKQKKPVALRFDANGRTIPLKDAVTIHGTPGNWLIQTRIDDWKEFIILE